MVEETKVVEEVKQVISDAKVQPSRVYVRLRPAVFDGSGHDMNGEAVAKSIDSFDD